MRSTTIQEERLSSSRLLSDRARSVRPIGAATAAKETTTSSTDCSTSTQLQSKCSTVCSGSVSSTTAGCMVEPATRVSALRRGAIRRDRRASSTSFCRVVRHTAIISGIRCGANKCNGHVGTATTSHPSGSVSATSAIQHGTNKRNGSGRTTNAGCVAKSNIHVHAAELYCW